MEKGKVYLSSQAEKVTSKGGTPVFVLLITHCRDTGIWLQGRSNDFTGAENLSIPHVFHPMGHRDLA